VCFLFFGEVGGGSEYLVEGVSYLSFGQGGRLRGFVRCLFWGGVNLL